MAIDPADLNILASTFRSIAVEMGDVMCRSAHSSIVREARDCSSCVSDRQGRVVAQPEMNAIHMNSMAAVFDYAREHMDLAALKPGEALITNNPYQLGQHLNDIFLMLPVFHQGALVAFTGSICHHLELGGMVAGSASAATEVYHEGLILPTMRVDVDKDLRGGGPVEQIIAANVRLPHIILGDFHAQLAATLRGRALIEAVYARYGVERVAEAMQEVQAYSERMMRATIRAIPDGVYEGEDWCDGFQLGDARIAVRAKVRVQGDEVEVDLTATDDQVAWPINSPKASTLSAVYTVFSALAGNRAPANDGTYRPIRVQTRHGSLVDPRHPAPVRGRMTGCSRVASALRRALVNALPERVPVAGNDSTNIVSLSRKRPEGGYEMFTETLAGGTGAGRGHDGESVVAQMLSNSSNTPVESLELDHAFVRIREYRQLADTGGAGRNRGGLGQRRVYEILEDGVLLTTNGDRHTGSPQGAGGGHSGVNSRYVILRGGREIRIPACTTQKLEQGDVFVVELTGGGGWGDPLERDRRAVVADLRQGRISADAARSVYGLPEDEIARNLPPPECAP